MLSRFDRGTVNPYPEGGNGGNAMKKAFAIIMLFTVLLLSACNSTEVPQNAYSGTDFQETEVSTTATEQETMTPENVTEAANNSSSQPVTESSATTGPSTEETVKKDGRTSEFSA